MKVKQGTTHAAIYIYRYHSPRDPAARRFRDIKPYRDYAAVLQIARTYQSLGRRDLLGIYSLPMTSIPVQRPTSLILDNTSFKKVFLLLQINQFAHPR